jgi:hypothetical protein
MAGLDPAIPLVEARPCDVIGIAGSSPAMTRMDYLRLRGFFFSNMARHVGLSE